MRGTLFNGFFSFSFCNFSGSFIFDWWGAGVVICLELGAALHMAQLMPLPLTVSCFSKIQIGFPFLVPAHPGSPGQKVIKRVCVYLVHCQLVLKSSLVFSIYLVSVARLTAAHQTRTHFP